MEMVHGAPKLNNRWLNMDLAEDENFIFKHPYFFENFTFKFEGLKPEIQKDFENTVKRMGATVSDDAKHVFTDILYTSFLDQKKNYYSISYLSDSILAEEPLEIEDYKLTNLVQSSNQSKFCCVNARYIWKSKSCMSYYNQSICCKLCITKRGLHCDESLKESNNLCFNQSNGETNDSDINEFNKELQYLGTDGVNEDMDGLQVDESIEIINNLSPVQHEINDVNVDENPDSIQPQFNGISQNNETNENNSDSSDIQIIEMQTDVDLEKPSCSTQRISKINTKSSIDRWKKARKISSDSDTSHDSEDFRRMSSKRNRKRRRLSSGLSTETVTNKSSSDSELIDNSEESSSTSLSKSSSNERQDFITRINEKRKKWWLDLPPPNRDGPSGTSRKRDYDYLEKRLMITYLVVNDLIDDSTSRRPWNALIDDGYLEYRTVESLNNHFRKILLPNIESFRLPKDIEKKFVDCRRLHIRSSHK